MFRAGDEVVLKNRPHTTKGGETFHRETRELIKNRTVLTLRCRSGSYTWHVRQGQFASSDWEWGEEDLELFLPQLEND